MMKIGCKESLERLQKELIGKDWFMTFLDFDAYKRRKTRRWRRIQIKRNGRKRCLSILPKQATSHQTERLNSIIEIFGN